MLFVCYPKCTTCQKARQWLDAHGVDYTVRDIKENNPTEAELRAWHAQSGLPLKRFWNTSGLQYRALELKDRLPQMSGSPCSRQTVCLCAVRSLWATILPFPASARPNGRRFYNEHGKRDLT